MPGRTVRVSDAALDVLKTLAHADGVSLQVELDRAVESYRRQRLLAEANEAFARLRTDDTAWQEELEERQAWDACVADGLD